MALSLNDIEALFACHGAAQYRKRRDAEVGLIEQQLAAGLQTASVGSAHHGGGHRHLARHAMQRNVGVKYARNGAGACAHGDLRKPFGIEHAHQHIVACAGNRFV